MEVSRGKVAGFHDRNLQSIHFINMKTHHKKKLIREFLKLLNTIQPFIDKDAEIVKDELSSSPKVEESSSDPQT